LDPKLERDPIGSVMRKTQLEDVRNISMEVYLHYIHYCMD